MTKQGWAPCAAPSNRVAHRRAEAGSTSGGGADDFRGVAWAQNRGVRGVEVRIDDGPWQPALLGAAYSNQTWRLWSLPWQTSSPGSHTITVRATDNTGAVQTSDHTDTVPDGATGWHSVNFTVT